MFITKYEQNETYDPLDFKCLLLNTSKMKLKCPIFQIVITEYEQNETQDPLDFKCV